MTDSTDAKRAARDGVVVMLVIEHDDILQLQLLEGRHGPGARVECQSIERTML